MGPVAASLKLKTLNDSPYIIPIIVGCYLFRHYKEISVGTKVIWFVILLITNYIGLIGLYIYLNTKKMR